MIGLNFGLTTLPQPLRRLFVRNVVLTQKKIDRQFRELLAQSNLSETEYRLYQNVSSKVAVQDTMYVGNGHHYFAVGLSALRLIEQVLQIHAPPNLLSILDMPSTRVVFSLLRDFRSILWEGLITEVTNSP